MQVPVAPFRQLIKDRIAAHDRQSFNHHGFRREETEALSGQQSVAAETGLTERQVYRVLHESETMEFATADKIVTHTVGPMAWHEDDELREIYESVDLAREDLVNPLDTPAAREQADERILEVWDKYQSRRHAGAELGLSPASYSRILDPALKRAGRPLTKTKPGYCKKGLHDMTVVGKAWDGGCRACRAIAARKRHQNKSGKTRAKRVAV